MSKHGLGGAPGVGVLIGVRVPVRGWRALAQHAPKYAVREAALALVVRGLDLPREAREAHEPAAAVPPAPKDGSPLYEYYKIRLY